MLIASMLGLALRTPRAPLRPPDVRSPWDYRRRNVTTPSDEREMPRSEESGRTISNDEGLPVNAAMLAQFERANP